MTSWPILERELRVWARRRSTYWGRLAVAAAGVLVCATPLLWSGSFVAPGNTGRYAFDGLVSAAFLLCCMACLLTADAISGERREGTLGLLLLTRVKHVDLLLGKLASSGLAAVLGLVAFMPLLALPLLTGGVSAGEALRKSVALLDTLFLALTIGLWASARGLERFRTACAALLFLTGLVFGPPLLGLFLPRTHLGLASPLAAISQSADLAYRTSAKGYWFSLGLIQLMGWGFLLATTIRLSRRVDKTQEAFHGSVAVVRPRRAADQAPSPSPVADSSPASSASVTPSAIQCSYCGRRNDAEATFCRECGTELRPKRIQRTGSWTLSSAPTPLHWLLSRQRGLKPLLWVAAGIGCCHLAFFQIVGRFIGLGMRTSFIGVFPVFGLAEATIEGGLFAWVASRFFVEARRTGELELLLTTPLGAQKLVSTQWETLKRLARGPVLVMAGLPLVLEGLVSLSGGYSPSPAWKFYYALSLLLSSANTILSVGALFWLAPWFGLQVVGQGRVIFWTVLLVRGLPYAAGLAWSLVYRSLMSGLGPQGGLWPGSLWIFGFLAPQVATLLIYWWLICAARGQLLHLAGTEPLDASRIPSRALAQIAAFIRSARSWRAA